MFLGIKLGVVFFISLESLRKKKNTNLNHTIFKKLFSVSIHPPFVEKAVYPKGPGIGDLTGMMKIFGQTWRPEWPGPSDIGALEGTTS